MCQAPANISQQALHTFTANAFLQELQWRMESKADPLNMEQVANGVVHSVTQETITKYKKLIDDPLLSETWMEAMAEELGRLAQGYKDTKGTSTEEFMDLEEITQIPKGKIVTYARIAVDYRPQKKMKIACELQLGEISLTAHTSLPHAQLTSPHQNANGTLPYLHMERGTYALTRRIST